MADAARINLATGDAPSTPATGQLTIYAKSDDKVYKKTSAGVEAEVGGITSNTPPVNAVAATGVIYFYVNPPAHGVEAGTAASGTIEVTGQPAVSPAETFTLYVMTWTFVTQRSTSGQISIDATAPFDAENQAILIKAALDADIGQTFTSVVTGALVTVTATTIGVIGNGNGYGFATDSPSLTLSGTGALEGGADKDDYTLTVGTTEFIFVAARAQAGEITIGADELETAANMAGAIETDNEDVYAQSIGYDSRANRWGVLLTAVTKDAASNSIGMDTNDTDKNYFDLQDSTLSGGVDGTVGTLNEIRQNGDYLYVCTNANTINDANWRQYTAQRKKVIEVVMTGPVAMTQDDQAWWVIPEEYVGWKIVRAAATVIGSNGDGNTSGEDLILCGSLLKNGSGVTLNNFLITNDTSSTRAQAAPLAPLPNPELILPAGDMIKWEVAVLPSSPPTGPVICELVIEEPIGGRQGG
jgi:hypothetical protein